MSAMPVELLLRRKNWPARNTPTVSLPSPFQSPHSGMSPGDPNANDVTLPGGVELVVYQTPFRKIPGVLRPSPFQSHANAPSFALPHRNCSSATPVVSVLRKNQIGVGGGGGGGGGSGPSMKSSVTQIVPRPSRATPIPTLL